MSGYNLNMPGIQALFQDPLGPVGQILEHKALNVEGLWKSLLLIPGSGRLYTTRFFRKGGKLYSYGSRPPHRASAPGMPPASDTGQLLASIGHAMRVEETVIVRVYAAKRYAIWLEHGTQYMAPRPFMRPGLEAGMKLP